MTGPRRNKIWAPPDFYGVQITRPNHYRAASASSALASGPQTAKFASHEGPFSPGAVVGPNDPCGANAIPSYAGPPKAGGRLAVPSAPPVPLPEYRGWQSPDGRRYQWRPQSSMMNGRIGRTHPAVDIFSPLHSQLVAAVTACAEFFTGAPEWGNYVVLTFKAAPAGLYRLVYAHLACFSCEGTNTRKRVVRKGEIIATASCSGNAGGLRSCRYQWPHESRTDHVHVELIKGATWPPVGIASRLDPTVALGWNIRIPCPLLDHQTLPNVQCNRPN